MEFTSLIKQQNILPIIGTPTALTAVMAQKAGAKAIYLSGGVLAANQYGLPDLGLTSLDNVLIEVNRITDVCDLPLLVDIDTGWGGLLGTTRAVKKLIKAGASGLHIEDQIDIKRCGHRPNKQLVNIKAMQDRIKACVDGKTDENFMIMARTDSFASEGLQGAIDRAHAYIEAGADSIFAEAFTSLDDYQTFTQNCSVPVLANMTEFGKTPCFTQDQLAHAGVKMALYPVTLARMMNNAAQTAIETILQKGTQESIIPYMQTRQTLYEVLNYYDYETKIDHYMDEQ
ncbi:methylisocitrate lyase [Facilibium subflavum]|uniref:methylisocitrate lyase n=1 Tax=Facilibium subflavum TaxID=2219058 RepID=UPI000E64D49C|nr:methylisocitrate lyase [Facilibium subflavum]